MKNLLTEIPTPQTYPEEKVENAFKTLFQSLQAQGQLKDVQLCVGFDSAQVEAFPMLSIICAESEQEMKGNINTGNYFCNVIISMVNDIDSDREQHKLLSSQMRDLLLNAALLSKLNGTNETTFIAVKVKTCQRQVEHNDANSLKHTTQILEIYCCGSKQ